MPTQSKIKPRALRPPDKIGVVSLASAADPGSLRAGCEALQQLSGCTVDCAELQPMGDFAGTAEARITSLLGMWRREEIGAIVGARGGYGSNSLCPRLALEAREYSFISAPKAFVGSSDNTSILLALDRAGLVSFHGPMAASDFACGRADAASFLAALSGMPQDFAFAPESGVRSLIGGEASGPITGGCLSVAVTTLGTPWEIDTAGKILFLEDVNERPFRIDRMLMHLMFADKFWNVRAVVFGQMKGCQSAEGEEPLQEMILRILHPLGVPVVFGFPSGHVDAGNLTLPFGVPSELSSSSSGVRLRVEAATISS